MDWKTPTSFVVIPFCCCFLLNFNPFSPARHPAVGFYSYFFLIFLASFWADFQIFAIFCTFSAYSSSLSLKFFICCLLALHTVSQQWQHKFWCNLKNNNASSAVMYHEGIYYTPKHTRIHTLQLHMCVCACVCVQRVYCVQQQVYASRQSFLVSFSKFIYFRHTHTPPFRLASFRACRRYRHPHTDTFITWWIAMGVTFLFQWWTALPTTT